MATVRCGLSSIQIATTALHIIPDTPLSEMLPSAIARSERGHGTLGVLFLDLDGFKAINDTFGHDAGDLVLKEVAKRMTTCIRQTDTAVRLAGDEFTVVLEGLKHGAEEASVFANRLIAAVSQLISIGPETVQIGVSIGVALHEPGQGSDWGVLLRRADEAMYVAKRAGKGCVAFG